VAPSPERLAQLLANLDSDEFATREQATKEMEALGDTAEPALRTALEKSPSAEARRRIDRLLARLPTRTPTGESLLGLRAVELLEHIDTLEARQFLRRLAARAPDARLTREAKAALERVTRKTAP
jgi:hypothetical protein